jgi:hypothetical protein
VGKDPDREVGQKAGVPDSLGRDFPLGLSHALRAAKLHDAIVADLFCNGSPLALNDELHDVNRESGLILQRPPKAVTSEVLAEIANAWDRVVLPALEAVPEEDTRALVLELAREANLHSVK